MQRCFAAVGAVLCLLAIAGCGSGSSSTVSDVKPEADIVETAGERLEAVFAGTDRDLPADGPKALPGKSVWVISCSAAAAGCEVPATAAVEAGRKLGWDMTLADGKLDPNVYNTHIRSATAAGADAIVLSLVDCALTTESLAAAKAAGIKIFGLYAMDCDDPYTQGEAVFDAQIDFGADGSFEEYVTNTLIPAIADYVIVKTEGAAKVIMLRENDTLAVRLSNDAFEAALKRCEDCVLYTVNFTGQDLFAGRLQAKVEAALTQYPDANVVMAPYDAAVLLGAGTAVAAAKKRGRELLLTGMEGLQPNIGYIDQGTQDFAIGLPSEWAGWAAIDGVNRVFAGVEQVDSGIGFQGIDAEHPVPTNTPFYDGNARSAGYRENYERIWGIG